MQATHESFLRQGGFRYLKRASALCVLSLALYLWHDPVGGPNGGTWLGYALGTLAAAMIGWLAWIGVRKRRYRSTSGTVKGWLSAHVYLGSSLAVITCLHSGFQFGWNIHTLAFALMILVMASGLYGVVVYARYPALITANIKDATRESLLASIVDLNEQALKMADQLGPEEHRIMLRSARRVRIGGGLREQLFGVPAPAQEDIQMLRSRLLPGQITGIGAELAADDMAHSTVSFMAGELASKDTTQANAKLLRTLLELIARRNELIKQVNEDIALHGRMQIWVYLHVPLTVALLAALAAHIVSVFIYR
jgi:hypothetical protein